MNQTTINLSNDEVGHYFLLLDARKCCINKGKVGCIEYRVVSTKDFRKYLTFFSSLLPSKFNASCNCFCASAAGETVSAVVLSGL